MSTLIEVDYPMVPTPGSRWVVDRSWASVVLILTGRNSKWVEARSAHDHSEYPQILNLKRALRVRLIAEDYQP